MPTVRCDSLQTVVAMLHTFHNTSSSTSHYTTELSGRIRASMKRSTGQGEACAYADSLCCADGRWSGAYWTNLLLRATPYVPLSVAQLAGHIISAATLGDAPSLERAHVGERQVRRLIAAGGLPPPRSLYSFGRCVRTIAALRCCGRTIGRSSLVTGWTEAASFSRCCVRLLGARPSRLRRRTDNELLELFIDRRGCPSRSSTGIRRCDT